MTDITNIFEAPSKSGFDKAMGSVGAGLSVANAATGFLDGIFGWSAKRQERAQKRLMQQQQAYWKEQQSILALQQLDQWNRENEYNDPTNYFKRLMAGAEANGLSKAAVLGDQPGGSVGVSASGVQSPGSTSAPGAGSPSLLGLGSASSLANLRQRAEIENIDADTMQKKMNAGLLDALTTTEHINWSLMETKEKLYKADIANKSQDTLLKRANTAYTSTLNRIANIEEEFTREFKNQDKTLRDLNIRKTEMEIGRGFAETIESLQRSSLVDYEKNKILSEIEYNMQAAALQVAYVRLANSNADMTDEQRRQLENAYGLHMQFLETNLSNARKSGVLLDKEAEAYHWYKGVHAFSELVNAACGALQTYSLGPFGKPGMRKIGY